MPTVRNKDIGSWNLSLKNEMNETFNERYNNIEQYGDIFPGRFICGMQKAEALSMNS